MLKLKLTALFAGLLVVLVLVMGYHPGAALASVPLGITLTPTEPPTATPTTQETVIPPGPTDTPTPTPGAPILTPTPTDTEVPATPHTPRRATPTSEAVLLPVTGEGPPDSGFSNPVILAILFLVTVGLGVVSYRLGARVRRWWS